MVNSVHKTVASLRDGYGVNLGKKFKKHVDDMPFRLNDGSNNTYSMLITFCASMLFAPAGYQLTDARSVQGSIDTVNLVNLSSG
ncbi:hypothetical protein [Colwellia sp. E150_009]